MSELNTNFRRFLLAWYYRGGLYSDRGTHSIIKNDRNNEAADSGGGLYIDDAEYGSLSTNDIADNTPDEVCIVRTDD